MLKETLKRVGVLVIATMLVSACTETTGVSTPTFAPVSTATQGTVATETVVPAVTSEATSTTESAATSEITGTSVMTGTSEVVPTSTVEMSTTVVATGTSGTVVPEGTVTNAVSITATPITMSGTITEAIASMGNLTAIMTALNTSGLLEQLNQQGPYTLFLPSDQAFSKLSNDTMSSLLSNQQHLLSVVQYHVVPANLSPSDLANMTSVKTLNGATLSVKVQNGTIYINDAQVIQNPVQASNGTIYVIDTVLTPPAQ